MKATLSILIVFIVALAVGMAGYYFEVNRYIKYVLMIAAIIVTQKLLRK